MAKKIGHNEASSSSRSQGESLVVDHGRRRGSCGYCKSSGYSSISHGIWAHSLTVDDYQDLLDRGWRRSGAFLYKPEMEKTCCSSYTIRLKADDFVMSKEQCRVLRRMQQYLDGILDEKNSSKVVGTMGTNDSSSAMDAKPVVGESSANYVSDIGKTEEYIAYLSNKIDSAISTCIERGEFPSVQLPKVIVKKLTPQAKKKLTGLSGDLLYTSSISFQIAATLRQSQSAENNLSQSELSRYVEVTPQAIAEKLASILDDGELSGLQIKACNGHLNFYSFTNDIASAEDPTFVDASNWFPKRSKANAKHGGMVNNYAVPSKNRRRLEIRTKRSSFDAEEYDLYRRYQIGVHNDKPYEVNESSYRRFLVDTPLIFVPPSGDGSVPPCGFGSFHQQYLIDGKLVAVGVVDILPRCLSSKYLFWDPDLAFLSLGKYSALREIGWVKENEVHCRSLQYYYLGYYIHSCRKMKYKAAYRPSELLCPLRYEWVPFDIAKPLLDRKPYVVLSDFKALQHELSSPSQASEISTDLKSNQQDHSGAIGDSDEEIEPEFEGSDSVYDDDSGSDDIGSTATLEELEAVDVGSTTMDLHGTRLKFKDLQQMVRGSQRKHLDSLEQQLHRYARVVGKELADRMIYSLNSLV